MEKIKENRPKSRVRKQKTGDGPTIVDPTKVDRFEEPFSNAQEMNFLKRQFYVGQLMTRNEDAAEEGKRSKVVVPDQSELEIITHQIFDELTLLKKRGDPYSELQVKHLLVKYNKTTLFQLALVLADQQLVDKTKKDELAWFTTDKKRNRLTRAIAGVAFNSAGVKYPAGMDPSTKGKAEGGEGGDGGEE